MKVDFSKELGNFKHLNCINLGPVISNFYTYELTKAYYRRINPAAVRLHDVPLWNPSMRLVDIHHMVTDGTSYLTLFPGESRNVTVSADSFRFEGGFRVLLKPYGKKEKIGIKLRE